MIAGVRRAPPGKANALFLPFEERCEDRSGLGLTISRNAVEENGGALEGCDEPSHGYIFSVVLPTEASRDD
jgi:nitrogen-specific signal transduction histidine kinase